MHVQITNSWATYGAASRGRVRETRLKARAAVGNFLRNQVYLRVMSGMGAYGRLDGYSTKKFYFSPGHTDKLKPMLYPAGIGNGPKGGSGKNYPAGKGYKAYVQEVTGQSSLFRLKNTGDLWADFRFFPVSTVNSDLSFGFSKAANNKAAIANEERRPGIFQFTQSDLDSAMQDMLLFLENTWSGSEYYKSKKRV